MGRPSGHRRLDIAYPQYHQQSIIRPDGLREMTENGRVKKQEPTRFPKRV